MRALLLLAALGGGSCLASCSKLPDIPAGVCGNAVLESHEDCDRFPIHQRSCRAPGTVGQCHMDCAPAADGTPNACPAGWGCDPDDVCRKVTGTYRESSERVLGNAWSLAASDFDGDGRDEVVGIARPTTFGFTKLRVHYFDRNGAPLETWTSTNLISTPTPFHLPGAPRSDLAFAAGGGVGVVSGEANRTLLSEPLPSYFIAHSDARLIPVLDNRIRDSASVLVLATRDGQAGLYRQSQTDVRIELTAELPGGVEDLAAEPVTAYLREDLTRYPCRDVVLAFRNARELSIYAPCEVDPFSGMTDWLDTPEPTTLALDPPDRIAQGVVVADLDGDGHLDVMVGASSGPYASYGDGDGFGPLHPYAIGVSDEAAKPSMPIAAGDLTGDGIADLVLPQGIWIADATAGTRNLVYGASFGKAGARWTEAVVADFNRDGNPDAVAASSLAVDIDFFNGTSSRSINPFSIATDRPVEHLAAGDFDGDFYNDLVFVQRSAGRDMPEELSIAYGNVRAAPSTPVAVTRLADVRQVCAFVNGSEYRVSNLALFYGQDGDDGVRGSALALVGGSTDRTLPWLLELSTFSEDGALNTARGIAIGMGAFLQPAQTDIAVLALGPSDPGKPFVYELWLLPDIGSKRGISTRLGWEFADIKPLIKRDSATTELMAVMAGGDLDGDGADELLLSAPDDSEQHCVISSANLIPTGPDRLQVLPAIVLDAPCAHQGQLSVVDLDADGANDALLLVGDEDARKLLVLWGDGSGLSADRVSELTPGDAQPLAFATFRAQAGAPLEIAYVTANAVRLLQAGKDARSFDDAGQLAELEQGTGIVAADVDGDGVNDLAVADQGAVRILRAELEAP